MTARAVIATLARSASAAPTTNHSVSRGPLDISWAAALRSALTRMVHGRITRLRGSCSASGDSANSSGSGRLAPCCTGRPVTEVAVIVHDLDVHGHAAADNRHHLRDDLGEIGLAGPGQVDREAHGPLQPLAVRIGVLEAGHHLIELAAQRRLEHRELPAGGGVLADEAHDRPGDRRAVADLHRIAPGRRPLPRPRRRPVGAVVDQEGFGRGAVGVPDEERFRVGIPREGRGHFLRAVGDLGRTGGAEVAAGQQPLGAGHVARHPHHDQIGGALRPLLDQQRRAAAPFADRPVGRRGQHHQRQADHGHGGHEHALRAPAPRGPAHRNSSRSR